MKNQSHRQKLKNFHQWKHAYSDEAKLSQLCNLACEMADKIDELEEITALYDAVNKSAKELPKDWNIHIAVEKGAAWAYLIAPDDSHPDVSECEGSLPEQVEHCLVIAKQMCAKQSA